MGGIQIWWRRKNRFCLEFMFGLVKFEFEFEFRFSDLGGGWGEGGGGLFFALYVV